MFRVVVISACIAAAFVGAILSRKSPQSAGKAGAIPTAPAPQTSQQILAQIPAPAGKSATDQALRVALAKVQEKDQAAARWVVLGDVLAQVLRDTADEHYYDLAEAAYGYALRLEPKNVDAMTGMAWVTGGRHIFGHSVSW